MKTHKSPENRADIAVMVRGNGFFYAVRRYVDDAIKARRKRNSIRHAAEELDRFPDYLKQDINWPAIAEHEEH